MNEDEQGRDKDGRASLQRKRDPRLDAAQTASVATGVDKETSAAAQLNGKAASKTTGGFRLARKITGIAGAILIAFCSWALVVYLQGGDPLLALGGSAVQEIATINAGSTANPHDDESASSKSSLGSSSESSSVDGSAGSSDDSSASSPDSDAASSDQQTSSGKGGEATSNSSSSRTGAASGASTSSGTSSSSGNASSSSASSGTSGASSSSGTTSSPAQPAQSNTITVSVSAGGSSSRLTLSKGATAYDALLALGVGVNAENTQYGVYVTAINGVAADANHGWTYTVNGVMPNVSAGGYTLSDGDSVVWTYVTVN